MGASGGKKYDPREKAKKVTRQQLLNELGKRCSSTGNRKQLCAVQMAEFFTCLKKNSGASERCISEQRALSDCMARDLNAKKTRGEAAELDVPGLQVRASHLEALSVACTNDDDASLVPHEIPLV
mmetsp:Transcript_1061/g.2955  ORF Transcript_1061/g.2955 Transcript_1061/m.2955 type:complete len:125 (+) Transcript_1061:194-568(+)